MDLEHGPVTSNGKSAPGPDPRIRHRIQIGMFRPIRVDHTNCLQVDIKTHSFLKFFKVPEASISSIYSKLAMRVFDVYANILKYMYSTRFSGGATRSETSSDAQPTPSVVTSLTHTIGSLPKPDNFKRRKKGSPEVKDT